jgi:hypothetical protein
VNTVHRRRRWRALAGVTALVVALVASGCSSSSGASSSGPLLNGSTTVASFHNGQTITVAMGPNRIYKPLLIVNIIMCADPGGSKAHLPTSFADCDGNTIQPNSVIAKPDGSFTESAYTIYRLPNHTLGEGKTLTPICDATHECVLYVGQDQDDFSKPKLFSEPFVVTGGEADPQQ